MQDFWTTSVFLTALGIFGLRIIDVSLGTVKLLYMVRGQRTITALLAFCESCVWLISAALVFGQLDNIWNMVGFAVGFATGTAVGMTIERWIGSGHVLVRIMTKDQGPDLLHGLRERGFGLTAVQAEGTEGPLKVVLVVARRKRTAEALRLVKELDKDAFVTIDPVSPAAGGYLLPTAVPSPLRK